MWNRMCLQGLKVLYGHQDLIEDVGITHNCYNVAATRAACMYCLA